MSFRYEINFILFFYKLRTITFFTHTQKESQDHDKGNFFFFVQSYTFVLVLNSDTLTTHTHKIQKIETLNL